MFLKSKTAKGKIYVYLHCYDKEKQSQSKSIYSFGRNDRALKLFREWDENFNLFPEALKRLGCSKRELKEWLQTMETGRTKTGKKFKAAV